MLSSDVLFRLSTMAVLAAATTSACAPERIADTHEVFFPWDERRVLCSVGIDDRTGNDLDNIREGMARALRRDEVLLLHSHAPGDDLPLSKLDGVLEAAADLGLEFFTYEDLRASPTPRPGVALAFDDNAVDAWYQSREIFARHGARVTFFVSRYPKLRDPQKRELHELADDGHAVESHGLGHLNAFEYVEENGLQAYIDDEFLPELELLRADGFSASVFAYPFGARTAQLDRALLKHVRLVRSISYTLPYPLVTDPCPE